MKSIIKRLSLLALMIFCAGYLAGCAAAVVGAAAGTAVAYHKGELKSTEKGTVQQVYSAALGAMNSMNLDTVTKSNDGLNAKILAKQQNGDNVAIDMEQKPSNLTEVKIRVGAFGDESRARVVLDHIRTQLDGSSTSGGN